MPFPRFLSLLASGLCLAAPGAWAGLIGDSVTLRYDYSGLPSTVDVLSVGNGVEISCTGGGSGNANVCSMLTAPNQTVDIGDLAITYTYSGTTGSGFSPVPINSFNFLSLDPGFSIGGVQLSTDIVGLDLSRVSFTGDSISIYMAGLPVASPTSSFTVTLLGRQVPEPASWLLTFLGLAAMARHVRQRSLSGTPDRRALR